MEQTRAGFGLCVRLAGAALGMALLTASVSVAETCKRCGKADCEYEVGVNLAGAEFAPRTLPGVEGKNFGWPTEKGLDYWKSKGVKLIRLPFLWERLQPTLNGDFDPTYFDGLKRSVKLMADRDMVVILDLHNYAKYRGAVLGSDELPMAAFADVWRRLATEFKEKPYVRGFGLMNEPAKCDWLSASQIAIDAIRTVDKTTPIYVANDYPGWYASHIKGDVAAWADEKLRIPDPKALRDPSDKIRWELHMYMDHDNSGTYRKTYAEEIARKDGPGARVSPELGVQRVKPFVEWLKKHNVRGLVGEYSVPAGDDIDPRWMVTLENAAKYMHANCLPSTYWAGGEYWTRGSITVIGANGWKPDSPRAREDRPQLLTILKYARDAKR